jgi:CRISPR/Cas system Type II protein with McrA/HNH and RuvC-like nuclease domain
MPLHQSSQDLLFNLEATTSSEAKRKWRQSIKEKWNNQCAYCGKEENLTLDHITPRSKGGSDRATNVVCACNKCNHSKGQQIWYDWYMKQPFFTTEKLSAIIEWQKQINDNEYYVYRPRKNINY